MPNFVLYRLLPHPLSTSGNWIGTQEPLWVGAFLGGAFGTFLLRQFFLAIPARARRRGPRRRREPVAASTATSTCRWPSPPSRRSRSSRSCGRWNDLIDPIIYLRDVSSFTLTAGLALFQGQYVGKWPLMMAGALVSVLPMIVLFILAQRHFVRGIAMSGIKG